jgi:hypothetical protein
MTSSVADRATASRPRRLSWPARVAWGIVALSIGCALAGAVLHVVNDNVGTTDTPGDPISAFGALIFSAIGALIVTRHLRHMLGWIFVSLGFSAVLGALLWEYGVLGLQTYPDSVPGAAEAIWISFWATIPIFALEPTLVLLVFPSGQLRGTAARIVGILSLCAMGGLITSLALTGFAPPESATVLEEHPSPFGTVDLPALLDPGLFIVLLVACAIASIVLLLRRLRRATGIERQQFKWVAYAMAMVVVTFILDFVARANSSPLIAITGPAISLAFALLPVTIGIAILRYQLFDIDRVISRTLVYGALSAGLAAIYLVSVLVLQRLLDPLTSGSDIAVAGSTLLAAALARPLRNRVQRVVDRRFYRRHYDAASEISRFAARLREQTDLEALTQEIRGVVNDTMQPSHVSVWIPQSAHSSQRHR